jgi:hypothetical protein
MSTVHYDTTFDLLRNLAFLSKKQQFCKHEGACTSNAVRGVVRGSVIGYAVKASISIALGLFFKRLYKQYFFIDRFTHLVQESFWKYYSARTHTASPCFWVRLLVHTKSYNALCV